MSEQTPEERIVFISCRARQDFHAPAGVEFACDGKQAAVVSMLSLAQGGHSSVAVGGGNVTTYRCLTCNRRFTISA